MDDLDRCERCAGLPCECESFVYIEDYDDECPTCKGSGVVNPLTAPKNFFCATTTTCPHCDGSGTFGNYILKNPP